MRPGKHCLGKSIVTLAFLQSGVVRRLAVAAWMLAGVQAAQAASLRIVAIGASNTSGWGVQSGYAYPERLQAMLRAKGINAEVKNAGIPMETTNGMLARIDRDV